MRASSNFSIIQGYFSIRSQALPGNGNQEALPPSSGGATKTAKRCLWPFHSALAQSYGLFDEFGIKSQET